MTNLYEKAKRSAKILALAGLAGLATGGCARDPLNFDIIEIEEGRQLRAYRDGHRKFVKIDSDTLPNNSPLISAWAYDGGLSGNGWSGINLTNVKGSPIEAYVNLDSLDAVYGRLRSKALGKKFRQGDKQ